MRAATEGNQSTLDFIPGNCFLGIVAKKYESFPLEQRMALFHDGTVRYGDAHPCVIKDGEPVMTRTIRIPASMYHPKLRSVDQACYIHHYYSRKNDHENNNGPQQLKQCRSGFYSMENGQATMAITPKSFAIKSAYDRDLRRAKDEQMYGYQSLDKGGTYLFEVEVDDPSLLEPIRKSLCGKHRIGRSRSAQYGLVEISLAEFSQPKCQIKTSLIKEKYYVVVYADGRLIFIDKDGNTTFRPEASHFGIKGTIDSQLSQVRTFQYAPWNFKRQTRDADRCGIEKGSVFVIETDECPEQLPSYVGSYQNEGFGKVIFNPHFLEAKCGSNGLAQYSIKETEYTQQQKNTGSEIPSDVSNATPLIQYLVQKAKLAEASAYIYETVNKFVDNYGHLFKNESFASQWGNIRNIAMGCSNTDELIWELFDRTTIEHHYATATDPVEEDRKVKIAYLNHGVAMEKWKYRDIDRIKYLRSFIEEAKNKERELNVELTIEAVVNLASEMAKKCKK
jgi:hypothetical protein